MPMDGFDVTFRGRVVRDVQAPYTGTGRNNREFSVVSAVCNGVIEVAPGVEVEVRGFQVVRFRNSSDDELFDTIAALKRDDEIEARLPVEWRPQRVMVNGRERERWSFVPGPVVGLNVLADVVKR